MTRIRTHNRRAKRRLHWKTRWFRMWQRHKKFDALSGARFHVPVFSYTIGRAVGSEHINELTHYEIGRNHVRCLYCDDTGDVHRADGEWLGPCPCGTPALRSEADRL